jgi:hypothetical protein
MRSNGADVYDVTLCKQRPCGQLITRVHVCEGEAEMARRRRTQLRVTMPAATWRVNTASDSTFVLTIVLMSSKLFSWTGAFPKANPAHMGSSYDTSSYIKSKEPNSKPLHSVSPALLTRMSTCKCVQHYQGA